MVAFALAQRLSPNLALALAGGVGALAALASLAIPVPMLEEAVIASGLAAFLPAAEPPLGATARICVGVAIGGLVATGTWLALSLLMAIRPQADAPGERIPTVRRADAHPDAPPRAPLLATRDLGMHPDAPVTASGHDVLELELPAIPPEPVIAMGSAEPVAPAPASASEAGPASTPVEEVAVAPETAQPPVPPAVQPMPADFDQPLAAFDPGAIPDVPLAPPPPVAPLRRDPRPPVYSADERFETFELTPPVRAVSAPASAPLSAPETEASVHALLDRLERGIARREARVEPKSHGLEDTLATLRRMAARA